MAEIKPFEPETGNAGVGKKMKNIFVTTFSWCHPHRHAPKEAEKCFRKDFRYVSGKHHLHSDHQQIQ